MLNSSDIKKIAQLANIAISPENIESLCKDLSNIINLIQQLEQENTEQVVPMAHPYETTQPLREDCVTEANQRNAFQAIAPQTEAGFYIVPQFVD